MCNMFNIMNMLQITKWVLYLIDFKQVNRFAARGLLLLVGASDVLNAKEKIGMLKIENYKNKSNMKINEKQWQK